MYLCCTVYPNLVGGSHRVLPSIYTWVYSGWENTLDCIHKLSDTDLVLGHLVFSRLWRHIDLPEGGREGWGEEGRGGRGDIGWREGERREGRGEGGREGGGKGCESRKYFIIFMLCLLEMPNQTTAYLATAGSGFRRSDITMNSYADVI